MYVKIFFILGCLVLSIIPQVSSEGEIPSYCNVWDDGCNICNVSGGEVISCTERACLTQGKPKCLDPAIPFDCKIWYDGCNECLVSIDGLACTDRACTEYEEPECRKNFSLFDRIIIWFKSILK